MQVRVYHLEMLSRPERAVLPPRDGLAVIQAHNPTLAYYRFLYNTVGNDYHWLSRRRLSDEELAALLRDPCNDVHVLLADGVPAGFAELCRRVQGEVELLQFGLMPEFIGKGLGKYLLQWTIDRAWSHNPRRFWLHTCSLDHPNALPTYLKAGFRIFKEDVIEREM